MEEQAPVAIVFDNNWSNWVEIKDDGELVFLSYGIGSSGIDFKIAIFNKRTISLDNLEKLKDLKCIAECNGWTYFCIDLKNRSIQPVKSPNLEIRGENASFEERQYIFVNFDENSEISFYPSLFDLIRCEENIPKGVFMVFDLEYFFLCMALNDQAMLKIAERLNL